MHVHVYHVVLIHCLYKQVLLRKIFVRLYYFEPLLLFCLRYIPYHRLDLFLRFEREYQVLHYVFPCRHLTPNQLCEICYITNRYMYLSLFYRCLNLDLSKFVSHCQSVRLHIHQIHVHMKGMVDVCKSFHRHITNRVVSYKMMNVALQLCS